MNLSGKKITVHDMCLRDGMHPKQHQITVEQMVRIAKAMDEAGIPLIEVTHGDGLGGASVNYGFPAASDQEYLTAVCKEMKKTKVSALLLPGIGTVDHLKMAVDCGISTIRVATHCTEADVSEQHLTMAAKYKGLDTVGFLMMAHMIGPEELVAQLKMMEDFGANCVYITDSAGYMLPDHVTERVALARAELRPETELGFHGHHNMAMGIANSLAAVEAGANRIDGSLAGSGRRRRQYAAGSVPRGVRPHGRRDRRGPVQGDGCGRRPDRAADGSCGAHRSRFADAGLCRRVLVVPVVCQAQRRRSTACPAAISWWNWGAAKPSAARRT